MRSRTLCLFLSTAVAAGCGEGTTTPDPPPSARVDPVFSPLPSLTFTAPPAGAARLDFDAQAGQVFATVDWTDRANDVVAVITGRGCHSVNDALAGICHDGNITTARTVCAGKPRTVAVNLHQPDAVRLWVVNMGQTGESGVVNVTHCKDAPDCGASGSCGRCSSEAGRRLCVS